MVHLLTDTVVQDGQDGDGRKVNKVSSMSTKAIAKGGIKPSHKGSYSSKKLKSNELPIKIVDKLNKSYVSVSQGKTRSKDNQVKAYCRTKDITKLEEPIVSHSEWAFIPMKVLEYNSPFDLDKDVVFHPMVPFTSNGETWKIYNEYNNYNKAFLSTESLENNLKMDVEWLQSQKQYMMNLTKYDLFTLKGYTHYGDVLVNSLLRDVIEWEKVKTMGLDFFSSFEYFPVYFQLDSIISHIVSNKHSSKLALYALFDKSEKTIVKLYAKTTNKSIPRTSPLNKYVELIANEYELWKHSDKYIILVSLWSLLHQSVYRKVIDLFRKDLSRIIYQSPALTKDITVFRGVKNDFYLTGAKNGFYKNIGFVSTSLDVEKAQFFQQLGDEFKRELSQCCIQRITLVKGTKALLMMQTSQYGDEKEVLLDHGCTYKIIEPKVLKTFYKEPNEKSFDICKTNTYQVYVSDIVLSS